MIRAGFGIRLHKGDIVYLLRTGEKAEILESQEFNGHGVKARVLETGKELTAWPSEVVLDQPREDVPPRLRRW